MFILSCKCTQYSSNLIFILFPPEFMKPYTASCTLCFPHLPFCFPERNSTNKEPYKSKSLHLRGCFVCLNQMYFYKQSIPYKTVVAKQVKPGFTNYQPRGQLEEFVENNCFCQDYTELILWKNKKIKYTPHFIFQYLILKYEVFFLKNGNQWK